MRGTPEERFWAKVAQDGDCWVWTAARDRYGYGHVSVDDKVQSAHRVSYQWMVGEIPEGLEIDHLCRNRACVNPWHLEPVTKTINQRRGAPATRARTACVNGHPRNEVTTYISKTGKPCCRICNAAASRRAHARRQARLRAA